MTYKKGKMDSLWTPRNNTSLDGLCFEAIDSSISQNIFHILKGLACNAEKTLYTVEDSKKIINIADFIRIYANIYTYMQIYIYLYYIWREWLKTKNKKKWFNKPNTAAWPCCWQKLLCSNTYFRISIFDPASQTVEMEGSYHLLSYKD